jgi:hypothetical protein
MFVSRLKTIIRRRKFMRQVRNSYVPLAAVLLLVLGTVLAACGDNTPTPAATTAAQTTQAVVTAPAAIPTAPLNSGATTAAATTTAPATTVAATTAAPTTVAATTAPATTAAATTAATTAGAAKKGGSITIVTTFEAKTMHPYNCTDVYCNAYLAKI